MLPVIRGPRSAGRFGIYPSTAVSAPTNSTLYRGDGKKVESVGGRSRSVISKKIAAVGGDWPLAKISDLRPGMKPPVWIAQSLSLQPREQDRAAFPQVR